MTPKQDEYGMALALSSSERPDLFRARDLLRIAHEKGDDRATYALATWYLNGNDVVDRDEPTGVAMLHKIENSNIAEALFDLAYAYDCGDHVESDDLKAFSLYMRAALLGDRESCSQISQYYAEGVTVPHDAALAQAWQTRSEQEERAISPPYRLWLND